ncbi:TPA: hypothetical protein MIP40_27990, partial [Klebsiella pneumoniae]|nr:hypothetical protein [Klebsiella pneumoniae]
KALGWLVRWHHSLNCALLSHRMKGKVFYCVLILSGGLQCHMVPLAAENLLPGKVQPLMTVAIFVYLQVRLNITGNASQKTPGKFARRSSAFMMVLRWMA